MQQDRFGPVDYVVIAFTDPATARAGFDRLVGLVDAGLIRVLDLEFIHSIDGVAATVTAGRVDKDFAHFNGAAAGLLDRDDLDRVAADLPKGSTAAVLVYEELSILGVIEGWETGGATVLTEGPVDMADLREALELEGIER